VIRLYIHQQRWTALFSARRFLLVLPLLRVVKRICTDEDARALRVHTKAEAPAFGSADPDRQVGRTSRRATHVESAASARRAQSRDPSPARRPRPPLR
jgi:hypothetical protein